MPLAVGVLGAICSTLQLTVPDINYILGLGTKNAG